MTKDHRVSAAELAAVRSSDTVRMTDLSEVTPLGTSLDASADMQARRTNSVTLVAADLLGSLDAARQYMHTRNFALGGATPADLLQTAKGEQTVLNELQAHADGGPL